MPELVREGSTPCRVRLAGPDRTGATRPFLPRTLPLPRKGVARRAHACRAMGARAITASPGRVAGAEATVASPRGRVAPAPAEAAAEPEAMEAKAAADPSRFSRFS